MLFLHIIKKDEDISCGESEFRKQKERLRKKALGYVGEKKVYYV